MPRIEFQGQIHEFPDSFTDEQIAEALRSESGVGKMLPAHVDKYKAKQERKAALRATLAAGKNLPGMPFGLSEANREMPAALGAVGGMYGGPPGAALGGMAGKALQYGTNPMLGEEQPQGQAPMNILGEGGLQGLLQGGGDLAAWGLNNVGRAAYPLMRDAMRVPAKVWNDFPEVDAIAEALRRRISPEPGPEMAGTVRAGRLRELMGRRTARAVDDAVAGGAKGIRPDRIAYGPEMNKVRQTLDDGTAAITDVKQIDDLVQNELLARHPNEIVTGGEYPTARVQIGDPNAALLGQKPKFANIRAQGPPTEVVSTPNYIPLDQAHAVRQYAGKVAWSGPGDDIGTMARGASASNWKLYNEGQWRAISKEMERIVPGFKNMNLETQKAIALEQAMKAAESPAKDAAISHNIAHGILKMFRGPKAVGKAALAAQAIGKSNRTPVAAEALRQAPRGISEILRYLSSPSDSTSQY